VNSKSPMVSVLVPSYNHGAYIRERIDSILTQTYQDFELIVIDDRSSDNSDAIITELQNQHGFKYVKNEFNSGSPFSAWERICQLAKGEYIWICESDDVADPRFLQSAIDSFSNSPKAVLFYSNSHVINERSEIISHTDRYFHDVWKETRWDSSFSSAGLSELALFQVRGQIVPNMSSALIKTAAFKLAFSNYLRRFKLTGDWLFIGEVLRHGDALFEYQALSYFRKHPVTARAQVKSAQSQAEFMLTKYRLFKLSGLKVSQFATVMGSDVVRFLYEPDSWATVLSKLVRLSWWNTIKMFSLMFLSLIFNRSYLSKFKGRYIHSKEFHANEDAGQDKP
jgi:glycosyltransferase involved in cell wall biosynthesis